MTLKAYLEQRYSKSTLKNNLYHIKRFTDYYQEYSPQANYKDVLNYMAHLRKNYDLHPKTLRHCLYGVKIYFNYLLAIGKRSDHPCSELHLKDKIQKEVQVDSLYSTTRLVQFYESCPFDGNTFVFNRNKLIISLLIYQALTVSEITSLKLDDVNLDSGVLFVKSNLSKQSKSPRSRTLSLHAQQVLLFYHYLKKDRSQLLQNSITKADKDILVLSSKGKRIHPHSINRIINQHRGLHERLQPLKIRQSVIANLLKKENDPRVVQVFSGHRSVSTTMQYMQTNFEKLQKSINEYHPLG